MTGLQIALIVLVVLAVDAVILARYLERRRERRSESVG
jgi:hypothetical protein